MDPCDIGTATGGAPAGRRPGGRWRRVARLTVATCAAAALLTGSGLLTYTYCSTTVVLPDDVPLPGARDGHPVDRVPVTTGQIPDHLARAVAAAEDRDFYEPGGVDLAGVLRAGWDNLTGAGTQDGSTITRRYARSAYANPTDRTCGRRLREAVLVSKLTDRYDKPTIMQFHLNTVYFGRGAYGVGAAARAYFGKPTERVTVAEAAVLVALIEPDAPTGHRGGDPSLDPEAARDRWNQVLDGMVEMGWLPRAQRPTAYPGVLPPPAVGGGAPVGTPNANH